MLREISIKILPKILRKTFEKIISKIRSKNLTKILSKILNVKIPFQYSQYCNFFNNIFQGK